MFICFVEMVDFFCVGGGRRFSGFSKSGFGKDGSRSEVRFFVLYDLSKLGKRG